MNENKEENLKNYNPVEEDQGNFGWAILGFFFPIIGLILFLCWVDNKKKSAKQAGIGALVGFLSKILIGVLFFVLAFIFAFGTIKEGVKNLDCTQYGEDFKLVEDDDKWFCVNEKTNERIKVLEVNDDGLIIKDKEFKYDEDGNINVDIGNGSIKVDINKNGEENPLEKTEETPEGEQKTE